MIKETPKTLRLMDRSSSLMKSRKDWTAKKPSLLKKWPFSSQVLTLKQSIKRACLLLLTSKNLWINSNNSRMIWKIIIIIWLSQLLKIWSSLVPLENKWSRIFTNNYSHSHWTKYLILILTSFIFIFTYIHFLKKIFRNNLK